MSEEIRPEDIAKKTVICRMPGMDAVTVRQDVAYQTTQSGDLLIDIYYPPDWKSETRLPAVVFVSGYPDPGIEKMLGCRFKEMGAYTSWGRLTAASGMAAITYTNREPATDLLALLQYIRHNAAELGIDEKRIGLWACSGNVPNALSALIEEGDSIRCAVFCYGLMLDLDGATSVADAARQWGFVNSCEGKSVADITQDVPLFIVRAGRDQMPRLNETIDRFVACALERNLPLTFVNHPSAPHAFDLFDQSETSIEIIRRILAFMQFHLAA
ncbi:MAG: hypothetical protein AB1631_03170 [Acidobacteriota bacterium]